ncbi:MAG: phytoene desaturase family protein [Coriobacteriales bacterium]
MAQYDYVIAGGGHNGLTTAAYLAKAGFSVCVVEKNSEVGGGIRCSKDIYPGFTHDRGGFMHFFTQANPLVLNDELKLQSKYGLKYIETDPAIASVFPDGSSVIFHRDVDKTCQHIAEYSEQDAEAYRKFYDWASPMLPMIATGAFNPPMALGSQYTMFENQGEFGQELMRVMMSSAMDISTEWFTDQRTIMATARYAAESMISPWLKGTGTNVLMMIPFAHMYGCKIPEGGSYKLAEALKACVLDNGGTVMVDSPIKKFKVVNGEAKGVILESGDEILAKHGVVSTLNVKQVFPHMIDGEVGEHYSERVQKTHKSDFAAFLVSAALTKPLSYADKRVDPTLFVETTGWFDDFQAAYQKFDRNSIVTDCPGIACFTHTDPTRAPEGQSAAYFYQFVPFDPVEAGPEGWANEEFKKQVESEIIESVKRFSDLTDDMILATSSLSPLDYENWNNAFVDGDILHLGMQQSQFNHCRPVIGWGDYKTPVDKLYLAGGSAHPGGGITCGGRATVQVLFGEHGIDFDKVIAE